MKRSVPLSAAAVIAALGLVAGAGTHAVLFDGDDNAGNIAAAGSLELFGNTNGSASGNGCTEVDFAEDDWKATFEIAAFGDMEPGTGSASTRSTVVCVRNAGSLDGELDLAAAAIVEREESCVDAESEAGDTTCGVAAGEFGHQILIDYVTYPQSSGECGAAPATGTTTATLHAADQASWAGAASGALETGVSLGALDADTTRCVGFTVRWPDDPAQGGAGSYDRDRANGDQVRFDLVWTLSQS